MNSAGPSEIVARKWPDEEIPNTNSRRFRIWDFLIFNMVRAKGLEPSHHC